MTPSELSALKSLLLQAHSAPVTKRYPSIADAHRARFAFYNALRQMRRAGDSFGDIKDQLEFVVTSMGGTGALTIQPKGTNLIGRVDEWQAGVPYSTGGAILPTTPTETLSTLQRQLQNETPQEVEANSPEEQMYQNILAINDWLDSIDASLSSVQHKQILAIRAELGPMTTLAEFQYQLSIHGIH
jgi:hypothetical protein